MSYRGRRARVFGLTWLSYASYYLCRKGLSVAKARLVARVGVSERGLAAIDTAYLVCYAVGQFGSGFLGDRLGARRLVGYGMLASAACCVVFGLSSATAFFLVAFGLNGLAQATGWPGNNKAMAAWYSPAERGAAMGVWSTCYQVGGLAATAIATLLLTSFGWRAVFLGPAAWVAVVGVLVLLFLEERPDREEARAPDPQVHLDRRAEQRLVLRSVHVWCYGASYFFIKLIRYSILFWLPYYLHTALGYPEGESGYLSVSFEVGGIVGAIGFGAYSDRTRLSRGALAALGLVGLAGALLLYSRIAAAGPLANFLGMALVGMLLFGPDALLSGAAAQDLGGRYAAGSAVGVVNGVGSLGAILQGAVTVGLREALGWGAVFHAFLAFALLSAACLIPTLKRRQAPA